MVLFRKGGSATAFFFPGKLPDHRGEDFAKALRSRRFRSIETAASEQVSAGWITIGDPTGNTFEAEHIEHGPALWLRLRMDKKALPAPWLAIHRAAAERAKGSKLTPREKRQLKEDLLETLLPRVLPSVQWVDALCLPERGLVLLMSTAARCRDVFAKLFKESFGIALVPGDPLHLAQHVNLGTEQLAYLDQVSPVRWPTAGKGSDVRRVRTAPDSQQDRQVEE